MFWIHNYGMNCFWFQLIAIAYLPPPQITCTTISNSEANVAKRLNDDRDFPLVRISSGKLAPWVVCNELCIMCIFPLFSINPFLSSAIVWKASWLRHISGGMSENMWFLFAILNVFLGCCDVVAYYPVPSLYDIRVSRYGTGQIPPPICGRTNSPILSPGENYKSDQEK